MSIRKWFEARHDRNVARANHEPRHSGAVSTKVSNDVRQGTATPSEAAPPPMTYREKLQAAFDASDEERWA